MADGWFEVTIRVRAEGGEEPGAPVTAEEVETAVQQIIDGASPEDVDGREIGILDSCACRARSCRDERGDE